MALSVIMIASVVSTDVLAEDFPSNSSGGYEITSTENTDKKDVNQNDNLNSNTNNIEESTNIAIESFTFRVEQKMLKIGDTVSVVPVINGEENCRKTAKEFSGLQLMRR